jgi:hypothetical protein
VGANPVYYTNYWGVICIFKKFKVVLTSQGWSLFKLNKIPDTVNGLQMEVSCHAPTKILLISILVMVNSD